MGLMFLGVSVWLMLIYLKLCRICALLEDEESEVVEDGDDN